MTADKDTISTAMNDAISGANLPYMEALYARYQSDPASVDAQWRSLFANGLDSGNTETHLLPVAHSDIEGQLAVSRLVDSYRALGCRSAKIDPLQIDERKPDPALSLSNHGLSDNELDKRYVSDIPGLASAKLRDILEALQTTYCGTITAEFMHISNQQERQWFIKQYEARRADPRCSKQEKLDLLERMISADALENYINTRFTGQKRFSLEGGDALVPMMDVLSKQAAKNNIKEVCIGMAHRGRLNLLINLLGKSPHTLFEEFEGKFKIGPNSSGDVKYHMGFSANLDYQGNLMHMALSFNPSHLEIVNPVVEGSVWARQARRKDTTGKDVLAILIHGDAALAGQGITMETLNMSQTRGYSTGGTIHVTVNNQVGFTTSEICDARSTYWCTDLAKMSECPVLHVNGNDPEACMYAVILAVDYRNQFGKDIFIDLVCYRRHGHNEQDEPKVTQPYMYSIISKLSNPAHEYAKQLFAEGVISDGTEQNMRDEYVAKLVAGTPANPLATEATISDFVDWSKYSQNKADWDIHSDTTISKADFKRLGEKLSQVPDGFIPHSRVQKIISNRAEMAAGKQSVDWGMAENLAYASLLDADYPVRLSGQDMGRGTFFHRHAIWHDQQRSSRDGGRYIPLANIRADQPYVHVIDSLLSESAVLGFEYGVTLTSPETLTVWEAQFGDFANSAQIVIDQFISSGEFKWGRLSGLVLLLPHGYEGQGPEHSSARLERYMQLCAEYNMQVCVPSTAAQIFHLLRRQMIRPIRRPLIVMTPKSLLRNKEVASPSEDFIKGGFQALIPESDSDINPSKIKKLIVCSGKIYYELRSLRTEKKQKDVAIIRLEQLYPFPHELFRKQISLYRKAKSVLWCQEEPGNQGAWHRIQHYLRRHLVSKQTLSYALRASSASTATGLATIHKAQQQEILEAALDTKE